MTRRGFLCLVSTVACLMSRREPAGAIRVASPNAVPWSNHFVDHEGWIVTAPDRDALVGARDAGFAADVRKRPVAGPR